jgi:hypothetical protein
MKGTRRAAKAEPCPQWTTAMGVVTTWKNDPSANISGFAGVWWHNVGILSTEQGRFSQLWFGFVLG